MTITKLRWGGGGGGGGVFLDIAKAFDNLWLEGIIYKLKRKGISGNLLNLLTDILRNRKQRVILNGQSLS